MVEQLGQGRKYSNNSHSFQVNRPITPNRFIATSANIPHVGRDNLNTLVLPPRQAIMFQDRSGAEVPSGPESPKASSKVNVRRRNSGAGRSAPLVNRIKDVAADVYQKT